MIQALAAKGAAGMKPGEPAATEEEATRAAQTAKGTAIQQAAKNPRSGSLCYRFCRHAMKRQGAAAHHRHGRR